MLNTFGPKDQLFGAVLEHYQRSVDQMLLLPLLTGGRGLEDIDHFFTQLGQLKAAGPGAHGCLIVNASADSTSPAARLDHATARYREALAAALAAALARAAEATEISTSHQAQRVEVLAALAVAVNWTARAAGGAAAQRLVESVRAIVAEWRTASRGGEK